MAVQGAQVAISTTAVRLDAAETTGDSRSTVRVKNTGASAVFLGASDVTSASGFTLAVGDSISVELGAGESLFGICAAATSSTIQALRTGI